MEQSPTIETADLLFEQGRFEEANAIYQSINSQEPENHLPILRMGEIAVLSNQLETADRHLSSVLKIDPENAKAKRLLGEAYVRQDRFLEASRLYSDLNRDGLVKVLERFQDLTPYEIEAEVLETAVEFLMRDPLPIVKLRINDGEEVNFLIDTGAASVILEESFALEIGVESFGSFKGTFLGGKKAPVKRGYLESITLGNIKAKNIPVDILNLKIVGIDIKGIIGTVLFYHFLTTLDYPNNRLILRRKDGAHKPKLEHSKNAHIQPIWMAGDHFTVAWGQINNGPQTLFFVDTGGGGMGILCSDRTMSEAGIKLPNDEGRDVIGGGGVARIIPFKIDKATLGSASRGNVQGIYSKNFPLESALGFRIGGIVSHEFLKVFSVTFDYDDMKLILEPL